MMNRVVVAALFVFLVALAACSQSTIKAQPLNNTVPQPASNCSAVTCGENAYCDAGVCMCSGGFKKCGNKCIPERSCCTNAECPSGKVCTNGVCADKPLCGYNEEWDFGSKSCICAKGAKYCKPQGKCIPANGCCEHIDCKSDQRCAPTTYSATVCVYYGAKKCRVAHEGVRTVFMTPVGDFDITLQNLLEGPMFDLKVNNDTTRRVRINESNTILNGTASIHVESMTVFGGYCREEPD
ncbi:MAG: hypothetical protein QXF14_02030 [Candidatus Woesearchaeota archaeon]